MIAGVGLGLGSGLASADQVYHSEHLRLAPVGGAPLRSGFVENIHASGPQVYAHEIYVLNGAQPSTTYQVTIYAYLTTNGTCGGSPVAVLPTATLQTNAVGNGQAQVVFTPEDVAAFRPATLDLRWALNKVGDATIRYQTTCSTVTLD